MTRLRIVAYNINAGNEALYDVLLHIDADIVALTEADDPHFVTTLAERLNMYHTWAKGSGDRHVATLSRFPISDWQIYNKPPLTQAALATTLATPARAGQGGEVTIYNIHFLPYLLLPFEVRRWQAVGKLLSVIDKRQSGPHLIVGDLNAIAPGDRVLQRRNPARMRRVMALQMFLIFRLAIPRLLRAGYVDCFRHLHPDKDGFTWMRGNRTTRYDYIMADKQFASALRTCRVVDDVAAVNTASDHFPLLAEFEMDALNEQ